MPVEFLTDDEAAAYGRYAGPPSQADLDRVFFLDDEDLALVGKHRGEHMRAGFALQLVTVRWLGTFLEDPLDVPGEVLDFVAGQLGMADPSQVKRYTEREKTRFDHQWEIRRARGYREFADAEAEFSGWVAARSRTTGDGPKAIFADGVAWLRERKVLLPGVTTLARLVAKVRDETTRQLWEELAALPDPVQRRALDRLLEVPPGSRVSDLERWRKGPAPRGSGPSIVKSLDQVAEISGLGLAGLGAEALVPPRRLAELARYGMTASASLIRRHPEARRMATLLATVRHLEAKSVDDALELLDLLMTTELVGRAQTASDKEKARRHPRLARASARLAVAVEALFDSDGWGGGGRGAPGVAGMGGDRGGRLPRRAARRAGGGDREHAAARRRGPGLAGRAGGPLPGGGPGPEGAARRDRLRGQRRGRAGAGGDAGAARRAGLPQPPDGPAGPRQADRRRRGDRAVAAAGVRPPGTRGRRGEPARLRLLRAGAVLAAPQAPRDLGRRLHQVAQPAGPAPGRARRGRRSATTC